MNGHPETTLKNNTYAYARMNMLMEYVYAPTDIIQQVAIIKSKCASEKSIKLVYTV